MHVLLLILKIIGIVFLIVLGIILLTVLLVLFVPIRYRVKGISQSADESGGIDFTWRIAARWLWGIVSVRFDYPEDTTVVLRIFGIAIRKRTKKERAGKAKKVKTDKRTKKAKKPDITEKSEKNDVADKQTEDNVIDSGTIGSNVNDSDDSGNTADNIEKNPAYDSVNNKKEKKAGFFTRIRNYFKSICDKIKNILLCLKSIKNNSGRFFAISGDKENKKAFRFLKGIIVKVIKHAGPNKVKAELIIGTGDPCNTGLLFGALGIAMAFIPGNYNITPDFYEQRLEGKVIIKGRIYMICMLYYMLKILFSKEFKTIKNQFDKVRT